MCLNKIILPSLVIGLLVIGHCSLAQAKEYDGIWFLGFNLQSPVFKNLVVRQAVDATLDKNMISLDLASSEVVPQSIVPPGMLGYNPDLQTTSHDLKQAKQLMKKAGFPASNKRLKTLSLLHTDGLVTVKIARKIRDDLGQLGIKLNLVEISYQDEVQWVKALRSGKYDLFLMGYKAGMDELFTSTEASADADSTTLLAPLFQSKGDANFMRYSNSQVDKLLEQLSGINQSLNEERDKKLRQINQQLNKDLPVIGLFYIERLP